MKPSPRMLATIVLLVAIALVPFVASLSSNPFLIKLVTRAVILSIAVLSLDLILGLGGMISFGHAIYLGIGGYAVAIAAHHGQYSAFVQWPIAIGLSALVALIVGALCLRSKGIYFIMITLAFCQLLYYLAVGSEAYGGDDGLTISRRSSFGSTIDLADKTTFFYFCFACLTGCLYLTWRLSKSHFGRVLQAARLNDGRAQSLGIPTFRYKLTAFVIAGTMCGLSGVLLANHTDFVSPGLLQWTLSGDLLIMVVLGGIGTLVGPIAGAMVFLLLEHALSLVTEHWHIVFGPFLVLMALSKHGGIAALVPKSYRRG